MIKRIICFILILFFGTMFGQSEIQKNFLSLENAIELGLKTNPRVKSAMEKINSANGKFWSGISLPSPEISFSYEYVPIGKNLSGAGEKLFGISQSFEIPTNYFLRGSKFNAEKEIARQEFLLAQLEIILRIKSQYFTVLSKQELLKNAKENLLIAEDFAKKASIRYEVGEGTNLEKLTAKVQYTEALNSVEIQESQLKSAWTELNLTLGLEMENEAEYQLTDKLEFNKLNYTLESLATDLISMHPQYRIREISLSNTSIDNTLAWSSLLPNFNIGYSKQTLDGNNNFYGASFGISIPLWFMFDQRGKIEEAGANVSIARAELQMAKNSLYLRLKNALIEVRNSERQVQLYQTDILPQAEEIFRIGAKSYDAGEINYLEYLQAKQMVISSRSNYINALLTYNLSIITLEDAIGKRIK